MDNGFKNAQRSYDRQEPPESIDIDCDKCHGNGCTHCDYTGEMTASPLEYKRIMRDKVQENDSAIEGDSET